ncbi:GNAT family N-acetyltransferase [Primorskyibacter sp. S187A]|uniref:GNAT family N-acetyltransferase n=1 Tax=Primorskyibacter sp. S187A TaxID=3415130 RepID=UPI003C7E6D22
MSIHSPLLSASLAAPLAQSREFGAALTHMGRPPLRLSLPGGRGEVQVVRRRFGPMTVGLVSRLDLERSDLRWLSAQTQARALLLNPETEEAGHGMCLRTPAAVAELSLSQPTDVLRACLKQKWRNRLNRAQDQKLKLTETTLFPTEGHWLLEMDARQARQKGYTNWPAALTLAYARANKGQARLFEARRTGEVISAMLFLCHGEVATYHIGWSGPEGRAAGAHHALIWHAMERLRARGIARLDLGQVATDAAPGLARFKLGTGARLKTLGGSWLALPALVRGQ